MSVLGNSESSAEAIKPAEAIAQIDPESTGVQQQHRHKTFQDIIGAYRYRGKNYPIPQRWNIAATIGNIIRHNDVGQYTGIAMIGMSGTGKTTLTKTIIHHITCVQKKTYTVEWFTGQDMINIDKIIKRLEKGQPYILVFDDASYTLQDAKKEDVARLANALTTIRHVTKSKIIIFLNFHYSKATLKFFRNQHFTFLTSVSTEELGNFQDLFKEQMPQIKQFAKIYNKMMLKGFFQIPIESFQRKYLQYKTNQPFRLGMVSEIADLHFVLYPREACGRCDPSEKDAGDLDQKGVEEIAEELMVQYKPQHLMNALKLYCYFKEGKKTLPQGYKPLIYFFEEMENVANFKWEDVYNACKVKYNDSTEKIKKNPIQAQAQAELRKKARKKLGTNLKKLYPNDPTTSEVPINSLADKIRQDIEDEEKEKAAAKKAAERERARKLKIKQKTEEEILTETEKWNDRPTGFVEDPLEEDDIKPDAINFNEEF